MEDIENKSSNRESKRPEDTPFKQQKLPAWQPILTPRWVITTFLIIGFSFIAIGVLVVLASQSVVEISQRYDNIIDCAIGDTCDVTLTIPEKMERPIYFYYQLSHFYQNHRRYVKSRSDDQLKGDILSESELDSCDPLVTFNGSLLYPCGLIANSFFTDTFNACILDNVGACVTPLTDNNWQKNGIAWPSDKEIKFIKRDLQPGESNIGPNNKPLPDVNNEDFIVWMRTAGLPTFKKLHRQIFDIDFEKGDQVQVTIDNSFRVSEFDGEKAIVFSTTSWLGGKNDFLGWAYIVVGIICIVLALFFGISQVIWPRVLGDEQYLNTEHKMLIQYLIIIYMGGIIISTL